MKNGNVSVNGLNVISVRLSTAVMGTIQRLLSLLVEATAEAARAMAYTGKKKSKSVNLVRANAKKTSRYLINVHAVCVFAISIGNRRACVSGICRNFVDCKSEQG